MGRSEITEPWDLKFSKTLNENCQITHKKCSSHFYSFNIFFSFLIALPASQSECCQNEFSKSQCEIFLKNFIGLICMLHFYSSSQRILHHFLKPTSVGCNLGFIYLSGASLLEGNFCFIYNRNLMLQHLVRFPNQSKQSLPSTLTCARVTTL